MSPSASFRWVGGGTLASDEVGALAWLAGGAERSVAGFYALAACLPVVRAYGAYDGAYGACVVALSYSASRYRDWTAAPLGGVRGVVVGRPLADCFCGLTCSL